jgi:hypothetical protein
MLTAVHYWQVYYKGFHGDLNEMYCVGKVRHWLCASGLMRFSVLSAPLIAECAALALWAVASAIVCSRV